MVWVPVQKPWLKNAGQQPPWSITARPVTTTFVGKGVKTGPLELAQQQPRAPPSFGPPRWQSNTAGANTGGFNGGGGGFGGGGGGGFRGNFGRFASNNSWQQNRGFNNWGPRKYQTIPDTLQIDKNARFQGQVKSFHKFNGYGWIELNQKGLLPGDQVFVFWKSIQTEDRFPQLSQGMTVEFGLHKYKSRAGSHVRAKAVSMPGGLMVSVQDDADLAKKSFVGGQHIRYTGTLKYYSVGWQQGKVLLDDGYALTEPVPKELKVELAEVNCAGKEPFNMKELQVEFGIWKTAKGQYKVYNMTLPGGAPFSKEALENRQVVGGRQYKGTVSRNMWKQGWGLIELQKGAALPPNVQAKIQQQQQQFNQQQSGKGKPQSDAIMLYYRDADIRDHEWLKTGQEVEFSLYVDDKGVGACDIH